MGPMGKYYKKKGGNYNEIQRNILLKTAYCRMGK